MKVQPIAEIEKQFMNQWVLMELTDWDKEGNPIKGIVIDHCVERDSLSETRKNLHKNKPGVKSYAFYTGPIIPEDMMVLL